ncbi:MULTISPECIES: chromosome partitioning protein [unclassified Crossiella]|uniref:MinD/ParA family ATP-binding protein n=1 Tax=unclassified Crossiella TaxID=2620835 RepID=UPI001FFFE639|nr:MULTISPECIES: chromosome partitioning protein [unclassified Crossiella]MCK2239761.1 chromosome partitioning protein [Crossiella sp. S99.2]MCK2252456.1 chromosome partitioning protein [Crossiella sp. S99.1]
MLLAICSLKGSPGATTLAAALGARWPAGQNPILVEADPAGGDLMARFRLADAPSLVTLAVAARRSTDLGLLARHTQRLPGGLRAVIGPVGAEQSRSALSVLAFGGLSTLRRAADQPDTTVIADCGRVDPDSPALPIIRNSDAMLLVARPHDDELAHVALKLREVQRWSRRPCFVLIGDGYPTRAVSQALRIPVLGRVPRDDKGAAVLCGHSNSRHSPVKSRLGEAAARIAILALAHRHAGNRDGTGPPSARRKTVPGTPVSGATLQPLCSRTRNGADT